jgi:molybdopterin-guanine dinucleotide biosynthesis protein A
VTSDDFAIAVLTGGRSRRVGRDKLELRRDGRTLLEHVLDGLPVPWPEEMVLVGPVRAIAAPLGTQVRFAREDPTGGGPLAAIEAALAATAAPIIVVLAGDTPGAGHGVGPLLAGIQDADAAVLVSASGLANPLSAAYRRSALLTALAQLQPTKDRAARLLLALLQWNPVPAPIGSDEDIDTLADVERHGFSGHNGDMTDDLDSLRAWTAELATALGVDIEVDVEGLLLLARDAAHAVDRKAAPVTAFLVGYAAAHNGGTDDAVRAASEVAEAQAKRWEQPTP